MQEVLAAIHSCPWSASCWHLAANITAYSLRTYVNIHKKAFTRRQTLKSHTAEFSVWENSDLPPYHNHITRWNHDKTTERLWRNDTHTHAMLLWGLDENLGSSLTQSAGSDHAAGADGKRQRSAVQTPRWDWKPRKGDERYAWLLQLQNATFPNQWLHLTVPMACC